MLIIDFWRTWRSGIFVSQIEEREDIVNDTMEGSTGSIDRIEDRYKISDLLKGVCVCRSGSRRIC